MWSTYCSHTLKRRIIPPKLSMRQLPPKLMKISFFYCRQRGIDEEEAVALVVNGFCKEVYKSYLWNCNGSSKIAAISLEDLLAKFERN